MSLIKYVLDASAILALLNKETGEEKVLTLLSESVVSTVNLAEVASKLIDAGMSQQAANTSVSILGIGKIIDFDAEMAWQSAALRPMTKKLGLSFGDRACLALSIKLNVPAVTADREWAKLKVCDIELIR